MTYCKATYRKYNTFGVVTYKPVVKTQYWQQTIDMHFTTPEDAKGQASKECKYINEINHE